MSLNADALAYLAAKGLSMEEVIEFARLQERRVDPTATERKRRQRARDMSHRDVTRDIPPNKETPPIPPKEINPPISPITSNEVMPPQPEIQVLKPDDVVEAWNILAGRHGLPKVRNLTDQRRRKLQTRLRATTFDDWTEAIQAIDRNPWLRGENDRGWRADFDFILQPKSFTKLIEGSYDQA